MTAFIRRAQRLGEFKLLLFDHHNVIEFRRGPTLKCTNFDFLILVGMVALKKDLMGTFLELGFSFPFHKKVSEI